MEDKARLPYAEATLNEVWRFCNVAPFGPPRRGKYIAELGTVRLERITDLKRYH